MEASEGRAFQKLTVSRWTIVVIAIAVIIALPVFAILVSLFSNTQSVWKHLAETVLTTYVINSLWLMFGVGAGVTAIGTATAWLVTMCQFPGSRIFTWALLLPLAAPAYILAYTYTEILEFYGPIQSGLRTLFGWTSTRDYWFPNVRSLWGAVLMLTLVLYPYVYLLARSAFLSQSVCTREASRSLGCNPWESFRRVALPLARPAIIAGLSLALMETLNDYATVQFFSVDTFSTGIYRTWFGMGERIAATQLSVFLLAFIFILIFLERWSRGRTRYFQISHTTKIPKKYQLKGSQRIFASIFCFIPLLFGFLIPSGFLLQMTVENWSRTFDQRFWEFAKNSLTVSGLAAIVAVAIAIILAYGLRLDPSFAVKASTRTATTGYAIPGSVIAVGILVSLGLFDNTIDAWMRSVLGISTGLLLSGTMFALVFAYVVRFLALSFSSIDASLTSIKPSLDNAARSLGHTATSTLLRIHLPLMCKGILAAAILVFVDVMKELSATLIIRPFNFDTLAIHVYNLAADERLAEASGSALAIVLVGLIPVMILSWKMER
jgi:iron(III) transport system permease protein